MKKYLLPLLVLISVFVLSGCVVRTYRITKERVDQELARGNRGYLKGQVSPKAEKERKTTRTTRVVEIELHSPIRFEKMPQQKPLKTEVIEKTQDQTLWGNRGYITQSQSPEIIETESVATGFEKYTVQKADTLQKISQKFYGSTKKWTKIYEANKGTLKGPDKIYPGQVINVPVEPTKETTENLK